MAAFYRPTFEKQGTGSALGWQNCAAASGAMLTDRATLDLKDPSPDTFRKATGDFSGGLAIAQVGTALTKYGVAHTVYDASDGFTFDHLVAALKRGQGAVVNGDYDVVPTRLSGSDTFDGLHSEYWHQVTSAGIVVGDPLNDGRRLANGRVVPKGYVTYPLSVAREYVEKFDRQVPGTGIHVALMDLRRLRSRGTYAVNVRAAATTSSAILGRIRGTTTLAWGGTVLGASVAGNRTWYRVWHPATSRIAYVHASVVRTV